MEKLIEKVLTKYSRKNLPASDMAKLIIAHMKVGIDGKKGWFLDMNSYDGQYQKAKEMIEEYQW